MKVPVRVHHVTVWRNEQSGHGCLTLTGANAIPPPIPSSYLVQYYCPGPAPAYQEPDDALKSSPASRASSALYPMTRRGRSAPSSPRSWTSTPRLSRLAWTEPPLTPSCTTPASLYRDFPAKSNRLESQDAGMIRPQCFPAFAMLLSMVSSFRIQAVRASFLGFPAARSRW